MVSKLVCIVVSYIGISCIRNTIPILILKYALDNIRNVAKIHVFSYFRSVPYIYISIMSKFNPPFLKLLSHNYKWIYEYYLMHIFQWSQFLFWNLANLIFLLLILSLDGFTKMSIEIVKIVSNWFLTCTYLNGYLHCSILYFSEKLGYFHTSLVLLNAASTFTNKNALFCFEFFRYRHTTYSCLAGSFKFVVVSGFMGVQYNYM